MSRDYPLSELDAEIVSALEGMNPTYVERFRELLRSAEIDTAVTGLPWRATFENHLQRHLKLMNSTVHPPERRRFHQKSTGVVAILDMGGLDTINNTFGYDAGNDALRHTADTMLEKMRPDSVISRGGRKADEFLAYFRDIEEVDAVHLLCRIQEGLMGYDKLPDGLVSSVGMVHYDPSGHLERTGVLIENYGTLLASADAAMYSAKDLRKNVYQNGRPTLVVCRYVAEGLGKPVRERFFLFEPLSGDFNPIS